MTMAEWVVNAIYVYSTWLILGSLLLERVFENDPDNV